MQHQGKDAKDRRDIRRFFKDFPGLLEKIEELLIALLQLPLVFPT
jgi:hypothetical protein